MRSGSRRTWSLLRLLLVSSLALAACTGGPDAAVVTVTSNVPPAVTTVSTAGRSPSQPGSSAPGGSGVGAASTAGGSSTGSASRPSSQSVPPNVDGGVPAGGTEPDGFVITKLKAGEKAPQFVVFSFDGVGWDQKWQYWFDIMQKVPLHFTGFLSGIYLLSTATANKYHGPGHAVGKSSIPFAAPSDLPVEIDNLNRALSAGDEIGTHFNGHFCDDNPPGGSDWNAADWNNELNQFFALLKNVDANNGIAARLNVAAPEVKGERTPCLTGDKADLYPALEAHGMDYDSSFTRTGLSWPVRSGDGKIWELGMSEFPLHGSGHPMITMDYNFYAQQEPGTVAGGSAPPVEKSKADSQQVLATYQDMLEAAQSDGVHEPIIIGNHFNDWNNNAYSDAVANFALAECGRPGIHCVPFRDLVDWLNAQDPKVLAALQNHKSNLGGCPYDKWPKCDGLIQY